MGQNNTPVNPWKYMVLGGRAVLQAWGEGQYLVYTCHIQLCACGRNLHELSSPPSWEVVTH